MKENFIDKLIRDIAKKRTKIMDDFFKAYIAERLGDKPNIKISDLELVEIHGDNWPTETTYFYRLKRGRKKRKVTV